MRTNSILLFLLFALLAVLAQAREPGEPIPVYGPAKVAVEDPDLLGDTILELGTLAVTPGEIWKVVIGDGLTPGGIPIHPENCVTGFSGVAVATTNLDMRSWSIKWGPWTAHGDANEWDLGYAGTDETWLRLVRDSGQAYLAYTFTIVDAMHYRFELAWAGDSESFPVLQVATNLAAGFDAYVDADPADVTYTQPDASHLVIDYAVPADYVFLSFRLFAASRLESGAYFSVPVHATGALTLDGTNVATVADVEGVADDLAAHEAATNPHGITPDLLGMRLWLTLRGLAISSDISEGFSHMFGFDEYLSFEEYMWEHNVPNVDFTLISTNSSTWNFRTVSRPKWNNVGLATTNDVAAVRADVDANADSILDLDNDITSLDNRVDLIEADYITSEDACAFATTDSLDAVEERVGEVEGMLEEYWCVWGATLLTPGVTNWVPTNWPARRVHCAIYINKIGDYKIALPKWFPSEPREFHFYLRKVGNTNSTLMVIGPQDITVSTSSSSSASFRTCNFYYTPNTGWIYGAQTWSALQVPTETMPADTTFLPTTDNPIPSTLSTPSFQSLRPQLTPDSIDADNIDHELMEEL